MSKLNSTLLLLAIFCGALFAAVFVYPDSATAGLAVAPSDSNQNKSRKATDDFFNGPILSIDITLTPEQTERLKHDERNYAEATIKDGTRAYRNVAIKLKGSAGSFQGFDGRPGMTLNFEKFKGAERFHGVKKIHLNNSVQDGTGLNELIAGEIARRAGVPASRCTHAFVKLNGRDLGLYVVKEAFTKELIGRFYQDASGDLYDGGFCHDLDEAMEKDAGDPEDKRALRELIEACREQDPAKRWTRLGKVLDIDRFMSFLAMEAMLCHWDGYNFNRNNYRLYQDPSSGKFSFFLHGMDQTFGDANFPLIRDVGGMVSNAVMRCPEAPKLYRERVQSLYANVFKPINWPARVSEAGEKVRTAVEAKTPGAGKDYANRVSEAKARVEGRIEGIGRQIENLPVPFEFDQNGVGILDKNWHEENSGGAHLSRVSVDDQNCLHIRATGSTSASWRRAMQLDPGKYRFEAEMKSVGVVPTVDGPGRGAGVRISGQSRSNAIQGNRDWQTLSHEFESGGGEVRLVAELRATAGEVWFGAMRLVKVK